MWTRLVARFPALRHRDARRYLGARLLVSIGVQMQTVAVGWQIYAITGNPFDLGLIGLSQFLPFVLLVLPAGHIADRYDRRRIVTACYLLGAVAAMLLLFLSLAQPRAVLPVFGVMALFGVVRAVNMPTSQALLPNLVPTSDFGNAVAVNTVAFQLATIGGPAIAGVLILLGTSVVYAIVAVLLLTAAVLTSRLERGRGSGQREPISLGTLVSGISFVRRNRPVLGAISLDLFAVLFGGATALLPAFATDILHVGPTGLGLLRAAPAAGAAAAAAIVAWRPVTRHVGTWMFGSVAIFGGGILAFGLSTSFALSLLALAVLGAADMVSVFIRHLLVQLQTPDAIRGRVSAVNAVFIGASNELGEFESGITAAWWTIVPAVVVGGIGTLAVTLTWAWLFPELRRLDEFPPPADATGIAGAAG